MIDDKELLAALRLLENHEVRITHCEARLDDLEEIAEKRNDRIWQIISGVLIGILTALVIWIMTDGRAPIT